ncbi:MAG: guanylate kinase [Planctomycetota bacterium]
MIDLKHYPGRLVVISGPSGAGKTSVCRALIEEPGVAMSVSATTRQKRAGETDGHDYYFLSDEEFESRVASGDFLEHAVYDGRRYGTLKSEVQAKLAKGFIVLLEIETKGSRQLRDQGVEGSYLFIVPPSQEELSNRLRSRSTDSARSIQRRLEIARKEYDLAHFYDHVIINDQLDEAIQDVRRLIGLGGGEV